MNAHILTIGAEILAGDILDTNARDLAVAFRDLGIAVTRRVTVTDDEAQIAEAVTASLAAAGVVFLTGGLGPTPDDRTRGGVARALGVGLRLREDLVETLRARYLSYGNRAMPPGNLVQVTLPEGAEAIPNPLGTAPGFRMEHGGAVLFAVPGIPVEMHAMLEGTILPWLRTHRPVRLLLSRSVRTLGIGESELVARFGAMLEGLAGVEVAFYPQTPGVNVKLTVQGGDAERERLDRAVQTVRGAMGSFVYGLDGETLAGAVGELLRRRGWRVATAESLTGGAIAAYLTSVPGASLTFDRAVVAYSNRAKVDLLGVPEALLAEHGAVSEPVARAMAEGLRTRSGVDVVVAATGIAGPSGATPEKPVGLVYSAVAAPGETRSWRSTHPGSRALVVKRTVRTDVNRLRLLLLDAP